MDTAIRKLSIAESAQRAAELAAVTLEHAPNPYEAGTVEHAEWAAAYARSFHAATSEESSS